MDYATTHMNEQVIVPVLAALATIMLGGAVLLARWLRRAPLQERLRSLSDLASGTTAPVHSSGGGAFAGIVGGIGSVVSGAGGSLTLRQQLTQAGYHDPNAAAIYIGAKLLLGLVGLGSVMLIPSHVQPLTKILLTGTIAGVMFFLPNLTTAARRERRRSEIRKHLPDAIDLLEICASAGMGLDMAWNSVADEVRTVCPNLADEMALTNLEIHLGSPRANALRHMARRTGADELSSLVAVLVQSERFGTSISDALRVYATSMREIRSQTAQEMAEKLAVKLIFPMVVFIFPAVVMVMAGPGFMMLYKALKAH